MELRNFFKKNNSKNSAQNEQDFYQKNTRKKFLKIFAAASLALITCATTLLATAPFGTGAANAAAESEMTAQEKLAAGTLNLNPETDPTIYTTESGLEIKFGGATLENGRFKGYTYVRMAGINWVIIGKSTTGFDKGLSLYSFFTDTAKGVSIPRDTTTPAGKAIENELFTPLDTVAGAVLNTSSLEKTTEEIPPGCVLMLSEDVITAVKFADASDANYASSLCSLRILLEGYCKNDNGVMTSTLGFTQSEMRLIQKQTLITAYYTKSTGRTQSTISAYLFPFASYSYTRSGTGDSASTDPNYTSQNYCIENYLDIYYNYNNNVASSISPASQSYWTRTGITDSYYYVYRILADGTFGTATSTSSLYYARPVFVLKLA